MIRALEINLKVLLRVLGGLGVVCVVCCVCVVGFGLSGCHSEADPVVDATRPHGDVTLTAKTSMVPEPTPVPEQAPELNQTDELPIVYTMALNGEIEPCGCTIETDYGGLRRRAAAVEALTKEYPNRILLSGGGLLDDFSENEKIKNDFILQGLLKMNYDAIGVQQVDLVFGAPFLLKHALPWVSTGLNQAGYSEHSFAEQITIERGGNKIVILSLMPQVDDGMGEGMAQDDILEPASELLKSLTKTDSLVIMISTLKPSQLPPSFSLKRVDVLLTPSDDEYFSQPLALDGTLWLQAGHRGMRMGVLKLKRNPMGSTNRYEPVHHEVVALDNTIVDAPSMDGWYSAYNETVRQAYEANNVLKKSYQTEQARYLGVQHCQGCHEPIVTAWSKTEHAHAFATLKNKGKAFDPACLKCHTVAFDQPGGFIDTQVSDHLKNVQCENCHVDTKAHVSDISQKPRLSHDSADQVCRQCHNKEHSPRFDFDSYWPAIAH